MCNKILLELTNGQKTICKDIFKDFFIPRIVKIFEYKDRKLIFIEDFPIFRNDAIRPYQEKLTDKNMHIFSWRWLAKDGRMSREGTPKIEEMIAELDCFKTGMK